jgi:hypothetical protein
MQVARNVAIIALAALGVTVLPGGGDAAQTVLTALTMGFLVAIGLFGLRFFRENRLTFDGLSDGRRAVLYGALGAIALLIAGTDEFFASGAGVLAWIGLMALSVLAIVRIWIDASTYS